MNRLRHTLEITLTVPLNTNDFLKGTENEKWKGVLEETWESQALNDTYNTSFRCSSRNWYEIVSNLYTNSYIYNFV